MSTWTPHQGFCSIMQGQPAGGCSFEEDPTIPADRARIFWDCRVDPMVLHAVARPCALTDRGALDMATCPVLVAVVRGSDGTEDALFGQGHLSARLHVSAGTLLQGPVCLGFEVEATTLLDERLATIGRMACLVTSRPLPVRYSWSATQVARRVLILKTLDALAGGLNQRAIAETLFGHARVASEWTGPSDHLRSRVRRLIRKSYALASTSARQQFNRLS